MRYSGFDGVTALLGARHIRADRQCPGAQATDFLDYRA